MNIIAKWPAPGTTAADRTVDASPSGDEGSDGWAEGLLRAVGLPVSRPRRLVLDALRGRDRPVTTSPAVSSLLLSR